MTRFCNNSLFRTLPGSPGFFTFFRIVFLLPAVALLVACEEGPTKIGSELLPGSDFVTIGSTDTLSVWSYNIYNSSFPTNDPLVAFIGSVRDPYFGTTTTEFVSQIRASGPFKFGPVTVDSVKLYLKLLNVRGGETDGANYLRLSEIADQIYTDTTYYSDTQPDTTGFEVIAQLPAFQSDTLNYMSIALPVEFGEYLIRDTSMLFYNNTKPDFRSFFKGLYFRVSSSGEPLIMAFSLALDASTGIHNNYFALYMHDTADVSVRYYFYLDAQHPNACYNRLVRDFSTADPDKQIQHLNDYTYRDTLTYMQYMNGIYTKLIFPGLDSLRKKLGSSRISINKARISIPVYYDGDQYTSLTVPNYLRLKYNQGDTLMVDVPDYSIGTSAKFFSGSLNSTDSSYYFNIPTFVQNYLEDTSGELKPELDVYLGASTSLTSVVLRANRNKYPVKFELTYTRF
jgi:hypothetical protein